MRSTLSAQTTHATITPLDLGYHNLKEGLAAFLIKTEEGPILVESGPAKCIEALKSALAAHGTELGEIKHVFLTHIHLDHGGASGQLTAAGATVHVHPIGAPHLIDPAKLNSSARRVFGDALDLWLGELQASPAEQISVVEADQTITVGNARFRAVQTPGHASHHHAWLLEMGAERHLFTGDVAGMRIPDTEFATLPLVAPEFDRDLWAESIQVVRALAPDAMWLTHFGRVRDQQAFLDQVADRVQRESAFISQLLDSHPDAQPESLIPEYQAWQLELAKAAGVPEETLARYCPPGHYTANIIGVRRWRSRRD